MKKYQFPKAERALLEGLRTPFAVYQFVDKRVVTLILSDGFCDLFGYADKAQAYYDMDHDMYKTTHPDDVARIADAALHFATEGGRYDVIYRVKLFHQQDYTLIHAIGEHVFTASGVRLAHVWYTLEGTYAADQAMDGALLNQSFSRTLHEQSMLQVNNYDQLTGLPSMTYFFELAEAGRDEMLRRGGQPALLFMDLSGLKFFNRDHGFAAGNKLLRAFAQVLIQYFSNENCSRFGQDHFVVFTDARGIEDTLRRLFNDCKKINDGLSLPVRVGIYLDQMERVDATTACDRAKLACDALRNTYVSAYNLYSVSLQNDIERQQYIIANLDRAIQEKWIQVYYQPIIRATNGRVCNEEALARWIDPTHGFISPGVFIPVLEEARLVYKLDLFVVEQVLEKMRRQAEAGLYIMPHSVNLSRADFSTIDIVEQVRRRVDAAGVERGKIAIEITESTIGRDYDYMKEQISRLRQMGFLVWMDDFGSGYSSLDVLQSIRFDLIKFDMRFMQQLGQGEGSKIILTEMMRMATALGVDTICEGVETADQVHFLQEIGCSKLQGFYYEKAIPLEKILERYAKGLQIGFEDPKESSYYESIGKINLYDLDVIANESENLFANYFNTLPMAIIEVKGDKARFVRTNQSYRAFMKRVFRIELTDETRLFVDMPVNDVQSFMNALHQCCQNGNRAFVDESLPDNTTVHSFIRRIAVNPVTGSVAVAVAVLSVVDADQGVTYAHIARALAADYFNLFYVDLETEKFIEYTTPAGGEELADERHGENFFAASREDALRYLYPEDQEAFIAAFTKENVVRTLDQQGAFTLTYRLLIRGRPVYVSMKAMRMDRQDRYIIIGVSNVDAQMRQKEVLMQFRQEQIAYNRINALAGDYICLYSVDPITEQYVEVSATQKYRGLNVPREGEHFFEQAQANALRVVSPDDLPLYKEKFTKDNVLRDIRQTGLFVHKYSLMFKGAFRPVSTRAALVQEPDGERLIVGVNNESEKAED